MMSPVKGMAGKTAKGRKGKPKKEPRKVNRPAVSAKRATHGPAAITSTMGSANSTAPVQLLPLRSISALSDYPTFSIKVGSIHGGTTIGDLIVAFPRAREVLMRHGLRFDVEEAGFVYMTLDIFSAIHGLPVHSLVQELHNASKEQPLQAAPQTPRPIATAPRA